MELQRALLVMLGGALGSLTRYALGGWIIAYTGAVFPWATLLINLTGSFVLGVFVGARDSGHFAFNPLWTPLFAIGFLGGYTTFSTFTVETMHLLSLRSYLLAGANILGSVALGLLAVGLGL